MKIRVIVSNVDKDTMVVRNYEFDDTNYLSHPWEVTVPEMIETVKEEHEAF